MLIFLEMNGELPFFLLKLFFPVLKLNIPNIICCGTRLPCFSYVSLIWRHHTPIDPISLGDKKEIYRRIRHWIQTKPTKTAILFVRTYFKQWKSFLNTQSFSMERFAQNLKCDEKKASKQGIPTMKIISLTQFIHFIIWMEKKCKLSLTFSFSSISFGFSFFSFGKQSMGLQLMHQLLTSTPHTKNQISQNNNWCRKLWSLYYYYDTNYFAHTIV